VGPIDEEQRYYLETRGIAPDVAERLIVLGFFSDLAGRAPFPGVGRWVEDAVRRRMAGRLSGAGEADG
jgi:Fe-S cluster assembly protein SufD